MVLILNDVTPNMEEYHVYRSLKKKFEKYNYLTIAENMLELDGREESTPVQKTADPTKKFSYFTRKRKDDKDKKDD